MQCEHSAKFHHLRFPQKMWALINLRPDAIYWSSKGKTVLMNYKVLDDYLLSPDSIFKTSNLSSFIRQLNLYGFRKVTSHSLDPSCNSKNPYLHEFMSEFFQSGKPELLNKIVRKTISPRKKMKHQKNDPGCGQELLRARRAFRLALKKAAQIGLHRDTRIKNDDKSSDYDKSIPVSIELCECNVSDDDDVIVVNDDTFEVNSSKTSSPNVKINDVNSLPIQDVPSFAYPDPLSLSVDAHEEQPTLLSNDMPNHSFVTICETIPFDPDSPSRDDIKSYFDVPIVDVDDEEEVDVCAMDGRSCSDGHGQKEDILNCVLPFCAVENKVTVEKNNYKSELVDSFSNEWDQMFRDISVENANCSAEFKEFYGQIYKSIDLLNT